MHESLVKAVMAAKLADDKKAENISVLDLEELRIFTDAFVICTGQTHLQLKAITNGIVEGLREAGFGKPVVEGDRNASWVILDYGDVVVHVMNPEAHGYYRLEDLWGDAEAVEWETAEIPAGAAAPKS